MGQAEFVDQPLQPLGFFQRIEVFALDVLDQRHGQRLLIRNVADENRYFGQVGLLGGPPTAFAGDDLVAFGARCLVDGAHQDGLHDALGLDRSRQFGQ